jgi:hypothetical protein
LSGPGGERLPLAEGVGLGQPVTVHVPAVEPHWWRFGGAFKARDYPAGDYVLVLGIMPTTPAGDESTPFVLKCESPQCAERSFTRDESTGVYTLRIPIEIGRRPFWRWWVIVPVVVVTVFLLVHILLWVTRKNFKKGIVFGTLRRPLDLRDHYDSGVHGFLSLMYRRPCYLRMTGPDDQITFYPADPRPSYSWFERLFKREQVARKEQTRRSMTLLAALPRNDRKCLLWLVEVEEPQEDKSAATPATGANGANADAKAKAEEQPIQVKASWHKAPLAVMDRDRPRRNKKVRIDGVEHNQRLSLTYPSKKSSHRPYITVERGKGKRFETLRKCAFDFKSTQSAPRRGRKRKKTRE